MATCPSCNSEVLTGVRWCTVCHTNIINRSAGRLASPGKRLGAYFLDVVIPLVAFLLIMVVGGLGVAAGGEKAGSAIGILLGVALYIVYIVWAIKLFIQGTTPGKKLLGMRVIKEDGRSAGFWTMLGREWIGKLISSIFLYLGFLWILFDRDRQGWHDKLASTYVVE